MLPNDRLTKLRESLGYNQAEFAELIELKQGSLSDIERKRVNSNGKITGVSQKILRILEERFNVNTDWITKGEGEVFLAHTPHIVDRIKDIMNHYGLNYYEFAEELNLKKLDKNRFIVDLHEGKEPSIDIINKICRAFPDVNRKYILSGLGHLLEKGRANITYAQKQEAEYALLEDQLELYKKMNKMLEANVEDLQKKLLQVEGAYDELLNKAKKDDNK